MKATSKKIIAAIFPALLTVFGLIAPPAQAALSSYSGTSALTYSFTVTNQTNPGNLSGLSVQGSFEQSTADSYVIATGNGAVNASNPTYGPVELAGSPFTQSFSVSGGVDSGTVDASHRGTTWLTFDNSGSDQYRVEVSLAYALDVQASGQTAYSMVSLDYYSADFAFASASPISVLALSDLAPGDSLTGTLPLFGFTLDPGTTQAMVGDVTITGYLEATPVPLPSGVWSFLSGCAALFRLATPRKKV